MRTRRHLKYFVLHLQVGDERPAPELAYEIQILDAQGRAQWTGHVGLAEACLAIEGHIVPTTVIEAARRLPCGCGAYVDESGEVVRPF